MNKDLKICLVVVAVMAASIFGFLYYSVPSTPIPVQVVERCKACGSPVYVEELDYFMPMIVGDMTVMVPIFKTVMHFCQRAHN